MFTHCRYPYCRAYMGNHPWAYCSDECRSRDAALAARERYYEENAELIERRLTRAFNIAVGLAYTLCAVGIVYFVWWV